MARANDSGKPVIRVGLVGWGYSAATFHLPLSEAVAGLSLAAAYTSRADEIHQRYPQIALHDSPESLMRDENLDLIVITSPNDNHYAQAKYCLEQGRHLVLEKPMVTRHDQAIELAELAASRSLILSVFQNRRWDGDFLTLQQLIAAEAVGEIGYFESHFDRFRPEPRRRWRELAGEGTGIWYDLGPHLIDQALCLFGPPRALTARCCQLRTNAESCDYFHTQLHYPDKEVVLHASPFVASPNRRFHLGGKAGTYEKYGLDPQEGQLKAGISPNAPAFGVEPEGQHGILYQADNQRTIATQPGCYQAFYQQLVDAIAGRGANPVNPTDVILQIRILELAMESSDTGRTLEIPI